MKLLLTVQKPPANDPLNFKSPRVLAARAHRGFNMLIQKTIDPAHQKFLF
jgi:hypothetical protein